MGVVYRSSQACGVVLPAGCKVYRFAQAQSSASHRRGSALRTGVAQCFAHARCNASHRRVVERFAQALQYDVLRKHPNSAVVL